jgi:hypothetical protein
MRISGNRRLLAVVGMSLLLVLAGCSGGGNGTASPSSNGDAGSPAANGNGGGTNGDASAMGSLSYDWTEGESYTYGLAGQSGLSYEWSVQSVSDGEVTAEIVSTFGEQSQTETISGPQGELLSSNNQTANIGTFIALRAPQAIAASNTLEVGNSWTYSTADYDFADSGGSTPITGEIEITGTDEVAGNQCYVMSITTSANDQTLNACVADGWPFALSFEVQMQGQTSEIVLQSSSRP